MTDRNPFGSKASLDTKAGAFDYFRLDALKDVADVAKLPFSIRILLESALRNVDDFAITEDHVKTIAQWGPDNAGKVEIPFKPSRVILQDFTGVPAVVDLAALRSSLARMGGDPKKINPQVPVDLVIDHSVQVDSFGSPDSLKINEQFEFERNRERYEFLHWGQKAFENFRAVPPGTGIVHQVNLEYLATAVSGRNGQAFPDSLVGTDSHTTMINGIGVLGWGVGGIEAEAVMLGQPIYMLMPEVVGFRLHGELKEGTTATDLVLTVTEMLRKHGVVGKFVEFTGPGMKQLSLADRATIANMAPEYGATMGFFPIDERSLEYMRLTGREDAQIDLVEQYCKANMLWHSAADAEPNFSAMLELDMSTVEPSLAGPKRPQDRLALKDMQSAFREAMDAPTGHSGFGVNDAEKDNNGKVEGTDAEITHGSVVIAAITSCTNTSNPSVLIGAGLLARKAVAKGLKTPPFVKTSLAPGSRVVSSYLEALGLDKDLEKLGFYTVGYGCTTCIGNSGPLPDNVAKAVRENNLVAASVLSGNRNFEGRVSPDARANYLASPPLVVAYALAGSVDKNLLDEPLGVDADGNDVFLKDIWPTQKEIQDAIAQVLTPEMFREQYGNTYTANELWNNIKGKDSEVYEWNEASTYIQEPPFFTGMTPDVEPIKPLSGMRVMAKLGDSVTTDHISPAGSFKPETPAGKYLTDRDVLPKDFNSYGSRRGNDRVMTRGTFANIRLRNQLAPGTEGGFTKDFTTGEISTIFDAAQNYKAQSTPLIVLAGKEYGTGSSRDWAAKGTILLGVKAVLAQSFERIHRSNLVFMGILPLQFKDGESHESLGLTGEETFSIPDLGDDVKPVQDLTVVAKAADGTETRFTVICRIDTPVEVNYYRNGGILHTVLRQLAK
ncbi:Aconitate hydratase [Sulfidibacter corallicola]|uniref:Aconitate hydratase n=1 Tax=Sulfidibacter corallicola TaxID=2818388 RepID=A0A8A4TE01_SULCO|nr:aconitate hydratase AcnA [Sulfidibacter corallicola]QTD47787.1 aconitate hydratase AcnA [Sulfidibacter corallicola]